MRIRDWSSDVCSSDLQSVCVEEPGGDAGRCRHRTRILPGHHAMGSSDFPTAGHGPAAVPGGVQCWQDAAAVPEGRNLRKCLLVDPQADRRRSEEHTSELQSLMRISYAVFCLKKKTTSYNKLN